MNMYENVAIVFWQCYGCRECFDSFHGMSQLQTSQWSHFRTIGYAVETRPELLSHTTTDPWQNRSVTKQIRDKIDPWQKSQTKHIRDQKEIYGKVVCGLLTIQEFNWITSISGSAVSPAVVRRLHHCRPHGIVFAQVRLLLGFGPL